MAILPNYEYDIFISYRHNDNHTGWVTKFVKNLQQELAATIKEPISIYFDANAHDGLLETHNVDKSLEGKLKCLIFIPILSQTYCDQKSFAWQHEFVAFNNFAKKDQFGRDIKLSNGNVASRILPIKIHDLDAEDKAVIEKEIDGVLRAIEFIFKSPGVNRPLRSNEDHPNDNENKTFYRDQINKVANAVKAIIHSLKNPETTLRNNGNEQTITHATTLKSKTKFLLAGGVSFILILAALFFYPIIVRSTESEVIDKSIAVLPFVNMSNDADQEYFSDGLSEELLNLLAKAGDLKVIGRTSSFSFKGKNEDLRVIADKLGVAYILEGSVRKSGNTLRITAQLISAADGAHLWSETFDRDLTDIFKVQDEIAMAVVTKLKATLLGEVPKSITQNTEAYTLYLMGKNFVNNRSKENYEKAMRCYKQSLALDSLFAPAWGRLGILYLNQTNNLYLQREEGLDLAKKAFDKALMLDSQLAIAYSGRGQVYLDLEHDTTNAEAYIEKALMLDPHSPQVLLSAGNVARDLGHHQEAVTLYRQSIAIDPLSEGAYQNLGFMLFHTGNLTGAKAISLKLLDLNPTRSGANYLLAVIQLEMGKYDPALVSILRENDEGLRFAGLSMIYYKLNRKEESDKALKELIDKYAVDYAFQIAEVYGYQGNNDLAFQWLKRARIQNDPGLDDINTSRFLRSVHDDARWLPFLKAVHI